MEKGKFYYLWLYLPNTVKLPLYTRNKKRLEKIARLILSSLASGKALLYRAGKDSPGLPAELVNDQIDKDTLFTNVILKFHTQGKVNFEVGEQALIESFLKFFRQAGQVVVRGDNTRMMVDADKYRQVILESRQSWLPIES